MNYSTKGMVTVDYSPAPGYRHEIQALGWKDIKNKAGDDFLSFLERIQFYLVISIRSGNCRHMADFEFFSCDQHSLLFLQPGQIQKFDISSNWDGILLIAKPEALGASHEYSREHNILAKLLPELPVHLKVSDMEKTACDELMDRIHIDSQTDRKVESTGLLLRKQLELLLLRMCMADHSTLDLEHHASNYITIYRRFKSLVEKYFRTVRYVSFYADKLNCSQKSLYRAVKSISGTTPKEILDKRVILEAKRLLAYTELPINSIASSLGFEDTSYFVKFFRRSMKYSPSSFRNSYQ